MEKELVDKENPTHYVNNKEFYQEIIEFRKENWDRVERDGLRPNIPESIGKKILDICNHLSFKHNFISYNKIKEDMISDAISNCIRYIWNFDPEKSENPFSYFTLVAQRSFIKRIQKEKKHMEKKQNFIEHKRTDLEIKEDNDEARIDGQIDAHLIQDFDYDVISTIQKLDRDRFQNAKRN